MQLHMEMDTSEKTRKRISGNMKYAKRGWISYKEETSVRGRRRKREEEEDEEPKTTLPLTPRRPPLM